MSWFEQPMRWGQINIREQEPPDFDVEWWEEFWRSIHLDGITLNCGGVWAYYPTQLQDQHRSRWLGDRDLFGELAAATKRCNMRVLARIDPSLSYLDVYYRHPDWFAQDSSGNLLKEPTLEDLYVTCLNGPYYWEFIPEIIHEIHSLYDIDGIFTSEWDGRRRICACPRCRRMFREYSGLDLPEREDPADMAWKQWYRWQENRFEALWQHWIARPNDMTTFFFHGTDQLGQVPFNILRAITGNQCYPTRIIFRIENVEQTDKFVGFQAWATLHTNWVVDAPAKLDMRVIRLTGTITQPNHVTGGCIPVS